jgi:hypothetical protein
MNDREILRNYGLSDTVYFELRDPDTDELATGIEFVTGDAKISKAGSAFANTDNPPEEVAGGVYRWDPSESEFVSGGTVVLKLVDLSEIKEWKDKVIMIYLNGIDVRSINKKTNAAANLSYFLDSWWDTYLVASPTPTKTVFKVNGGNSADDFYNRSILVFTTGSNKGVGRIVSDWNGTTKIITVDEELPYTPNGDESILIISLPVRSSVSGIIDANITKINGLSNIDGMTISYIYELMAAMANGRFKKDVPSVGKLTIYKRDNLTPLTVVSVNENERTRDS